jgi:hypothetical protein
MDAVSRHIIMESLRSIISEQAAKPGAPLETDNTKTDAGDSPFTPAEKKFLGKFDAYGSKTMGIIYSVSDIGVREFITRSGKDFNLTPAILLRLVRDNIIKIVPYTGWGRDDSYTLELQLPLEDIEGFGAEDKKNVEKGSDASGAPAPGSEPAPEPITAGYVRYGKVLLESAKIAKQLIAETKHVKDIVHVKDSRMLKTLPKQYIKHMEHMIASLSKKKYTVAEKQRLMADIFDNLRINFNLSDKQIAKSYEMHKKQKRLAKIVKNK